MKNLLKYIGLSKKGKKDTSEDKSENASSNYNQHDNSASNNEDNYQTENPQIYVNERIKEQNQDQQSERKTLDVLVIDDLPENLKSAEKMFEGIEELHKGNFDRRYFRTEFPESGSEQDKKNIDDPRNLSTLMRYNFEPHYTDNGKEALEKIHGTNPEIILTDLFFHYYKNETPQEIRDQLADVLGPFGVKNTYGFDLNHKNAQEMINVNKGWYEGKDTPPMGLYIFLNKNYGSIVSLNSNMAGHGYKTDPIIVWNNRLTGYSENKYKSLQNSMGKHYDINLYNTNDIALNHISADSIENPKEWATPLIRGIKEYESNERKPKK